MSWLMSAPDLTWSRIDFDRTLDVADVHRFVLSIIADTGLGAVIFETERQAEEVVFRVGTTKPVDIKRLFATFMPQATITSTMRSLAAAGGAWSVKSNTRRRSLRIEDPEAATQRLLGSMSVKGSVHQLVVGRRWRARVVSPDAVSFRSESWAGALAEAMTVGQRPLDGEQRRATGHKLAEPGAEVSLRLLLPGRSGKAGRLVGRYEAALQSLESPGLRLRAASSSWKAATAARPAGQQLRLNASEITTLLAWPLGDRSYHGLDRSGSRLRPLSTEGSQDETERVVGHGLHPSTPGEAVLPVRDGLRHLWALGPTGVGKSTLLQNLALQDIAAGRGVIVIDPKGDLVDDIAARVAEDDLPRVVILDPARRDHVVGFNPLAVAQHEIELTVDGVVHVMRSLNADSWGPRTQDILHASLLTLAASPQPTLAALPQLLTDRRFRQGLTANQSPPVRSFWSWYEAISAAERASVIAPVLNKIRPFTMRSSLRAMLGQTAPTVDLQTVFSRRTVLLVPLRKGEIGAEAAALLGALVVSRLWQLAQMRTEISAVDRDPVFAYLDEFQDYLRLPTDFSDVLAQARGLGLGLVLAHQHLAQLNPVVRAAVKANAQSQIMFRLGSDDAGVITKTTPHLDPTDFGSLPPYNAYAKLLNDGAASDFGSIATLPAGPVSRDHRTAADNIAKQYGVAPEVVDKQLYGHTDDSPGDNELIGVRQRGKR